jgi:hypothetical protein
MSTQAPAQQPWPARQHVPLQAASPAPQVRQSVPVVLHPFRHVVITDVAHWPLPLHIVAADLMLFVHD